MSLFDDLPDICRRNVALGPLTWFGLGGPAEYLIEPQSVEQLAEVVRRCHASGTPIRFLGLGANVLAPDEGVSGAVIRLTSPAFRRVDYDETIVIAGAGVDLTRLVLATVRKGLAGLEVLAGVPGTVGGGISMNCGGRHGEIGPRLRSVRVVRPDGGVEERDPQRLALGYRHCELHGAVLVSATFQLAAMDPIELDRRYRGILDEKRRTQPRMGEHSAGCIFRNPDGHAAGALIDRAGFKGFRRGSAAVSTRHANFIIADRDGRAADVKHLVQMIRDRVEDNYGVRLEPEVKIW